MPTTSGFVGCLSVVVRGTTTTLSIFTNILLGAVFFVAVTAAADFVFAVAWCCWSSSLLLMSSSLHYLGAEVAG
jgi:hypothetical protein